MKKSIVAATLAFLAAVPPTHSQTMIGKNNITLQSDRMTPEALWAMGRVGGAQASPDGRKIVYRVGYYSVAENKGHQVLYVSNADGTGKRQLTTTADNETDAAWIEGGRRIAFLTKGQLWSMNPDGTDRRQLTHSSVDIEGFLFSPDGRYVAWQSMKNDGYESDRNRLCVYTLATGEKRYVSEAFDSNVDDYCWAANSQTLYFIGVWHGCVNMYQTNLAGRVMQLTDGWNDYGSLQLLGNTGKLLATRHSFSHPDDLFVVTPSKKEKKADVRQITDENKHIFDQLEIGKVQQRWVSTVDGKQELVWIILPPHFDATKKYPALLFCEGGPQSPVSQFWSYRWNFQIMAANDYVIIAPNRRGLPGFGSEWNEEISGDWTGLCMSDYLAAVDDAANNLPFVDKDRLGCVGASFGGFSVYYLAGHHDKRFKAFISHDGAFNLEAMYTETEENWFSNWEYEDAYWNKDRSAAASRTYDHSPHRFVDRWDTPILCIHGEKDYRINATQGMSAFNAARMRGIPAELLIFPDENHWVLKPQNGILWQRTFFDWLDRWLKK